LLETLGQSFYAVRMLMQFGREVLRVRVDINSLLGLVSKDFVQRVYLYLDVIHPAINFFTIRLDIKNIHGMGPLDPCEYLIEPLVIGFQGEEVPSHGIKVAADLMNPFFVGLERIDDVLGHQQLLYLFERQSGLDELLNFVNGLGSGIVHDLFQVTLHVRAELLILI
jgi:hypothetical protein